MRPLIALLLLTGLPVAATEVTQLDWLSGCWAYDGREPGSGEYWMSPAGGSMLAVSRTVRNGRSVGFEYLRIAEVEQQSLALFASPGGSSAVRFDLISLTNTEVRFENPEHDFPQRIIYRLGEAGALVGRIEGQSDGKPVVIEFPMTSVRCEAFGL